ncbi:MAG: mechanosensitive ion channel family protein [Theionarchaea archaeon]|nr:MAG: hypothetical protein AYK19_10310 [Theionarchaea archaeon DG-70-1]MBU7029762.1 mechanosensitive ion channel family protein [Theionarchaea archaeon]
MILEYLSKYAYEIIGIIIAFSAAKILIHVLHKIIDRIYKEEPLKNQMRLLISGILYFLALAVSVAHLGFTSWLYPLLTSAGIVGIIIGISAQAPLSNIIAGIILLADKPFEPGDYISILTLQGVQTGKVLSMGFRSTKLKSFEENIIIIPNSVISSNNVVNLSAEDKHLRASARFSVEKDKVAEALEKLENIGKQVDRDGKPELLVKEVSNSTVILELRVLIPGVEGRDEIISQINKQYLNLN